jgi:pimeloyl-ACP methyl ester carboxylesterase
MRDTETYSVENSLGLKNLPPGEALEAHAFVGAIMDSAFGGQPYAHAVEAWQQVQTRPWAFGLPPSTHFYWSFSRKIAAYDALAQWRRVAAPTLLVYGEADERVPPRTSAARIAEAYLGGRGTAFKVLIFPGADHTFRLPAQAGHAFAWPRTAPGYPEALIHWAVATVERAAN